MDWLSDYSRTLSTEIEIGEQVSSSGQAAPVQTVGPDAAPTDVLESVHLEDPSHNLGRNPSLAVPPPNAHPKLMVPTGARPPLAHKMKIWMAAFVVLAWAAHPTSGAPASFCA